MQDLGGQPVPRVHHRVLQPSHVPVEQGSSICASVGQSTRRSFPDVKRTEGGHPTQSRLGGVSTAVAAVGASIDALGLLDHADASDLGVAQALAVH